MMDCAVPTVIRPYFRMCWLQDWWRQLNCATNIGYLMSEIFKHDIAPISDVYNAENAL